MYKVTRKAILILVFLLSLIGFPFIMGLMLLTADNFGDFVSDFKGFYSGVLEEISN